MRKLISPYSGIIFFIASIFIVSAYVSGCKSGSGYAEATRIGMDSPVTIKVYAENDARAEDLLEKAYAELQRLETIMEPVKGDGELKRINSSNGSDWTEISPELKEVLERSIHYHAVTEGAFDPTIAPVKWLWDFDDGGKLPDSGDLKKTIPFVGIENIELKDNRLRYKHPEVKLDLGGIGKGYAADRVKDILKKGGASAALVNVSGDIVTFGEKPDGSKWAIGMRHPRSGGIALIQNIDLPAVATSGDYERYFEVEGVRYHHLLDPRTGYPSKASVSVTVWARRAIDSDILSTALFILGPEKGIDIVEQLEDVEAFFFYEEDGELKTLATSGIAGKVRL